MMTLKDHERRITALEVWLAEVEGSHGETLYDLQRARVKNDLRWSRMFAHLKITEVTDHDIDEALDQA